MELLILTPGFPEDEQDTTCIPYLQDFVLGLQQYNPTIHIKIIAFQYPLKRGVYTWHGIPVYSAGGSNKKGLRKWLTWRRVQQQARKWITPATVLHSFWLTEATEVAAALARSYQLRHIASIMGQDALLTNVYLQRIPFGKVTVVAPNEKAAGYFHIHTARDVAAIIPNAIAPIPFEVKQRDIDILFVGSLIELKQPQLFTDLAAQLTSHYPQLKATMIGKGPLLHELSAKVEQLKLPIILTGEMDRSAVHATMLRAKVLVHTSRYEGHSTVISEALACGCRVVCFAVGHTEHPAVQEVTGYTQMVEAVQQVIREGALQTGAYPDEQREALHRYYQLYKG